MDSLQPSMFEEKVHLATLMPEPTPEFTNALWSHISKQRRSEFNPRHRFRLTWVLFASILLILVVLFLGLGPQRVIAAVQSLFSYLPGVGAVKNIDESTLLTGPVRVEREGYVVTIENLVSSPQRTWLRLRVEGSAYPTSMDGREENPVLKVGGFADLQPNQSDIYSGDGLWAEYQFPSLPAGFDPITLFLPQLPQAIKGKAPENWTIPLHLRKAGPKDTLPGAWSGPRDSPLINGVALSLVEITRSADQTLLKVRVQTPTLNASQIPDWNSHLSLKDDHGQIYPLTPVNTIDNGRVVTFRTRSFDAGASLSLSLDRVLLVEDQFSGGSGPVFQFDPGANPMIGQHWALDQSLQTGAFRLHISGATLQKDQNGELRLEFEVEQVAGNVQGVMFNCSPVECGGALGSDLNEKIGEPMHPALVLKGLPDARIKVTLGNLYYSLEGPWVIRFQLESVPAGMRPVLTATPTAAPTVISTPAKNLPFFDPVAAQAVNLFEQGYAPFRSGSGWVHLSTQNIADHDPATIQTTKTSLSNEWFELGQDGTILRSIQRLITPDGEMHETVNIGKFSYDFSAQKQLPGSGEPTKIELTGEVQVYWRRLEAAGLPLYQFNSQHLGQPALLISPFNQDGFPTSRAEYDRLKTATGVPMLVWIDAVTGQFLRWELLVPVGDDGTWGDSSSFEVEALGRVNAPPAAAQWLLKQVSLSADGGELAIQTPVAQTPTEKLAEEVCQLLQKGFKSLYGQSGWVHITSEITNNEPNSGQIGPAHSFSEIWQYVEADGTLSKLVWQERTAEGTVWRKIARVGKTQVDLISGTASEDESLLAKIHPDTLAVRILSSDENGVQVLREEANLDGTACLVITETEAYNPAIQLGGFQKPIQKAETKTWIDRDSGQILQVQMIYTDVEDSQVTSPVRYTLYERMETPPQGVLDILSQVKTP